MKMTAPTTDIRFNLAMERGEVREVMGWSFVSRLEKLADELLSKIDCPEVFYIIYSAKWDYIERKIKEMWQVTDERPANQMFGQVIYEVHRSGKAEVWALPLDVPVPENEYSDEYVLDNAERIKTLPLSNESFQEIK